MAFIRQYSRAYQGDIGDPFSLRVPKKLRKMKLGRALGKLATGALSFVPGLGAVASPLMRAIQGISAKYGVPVETLAGFARSYGYDVGDPGPKPKRKQAASGTKAKGRAKKERRAEKAAKPRARKKGPGKPKIDVGAAISQIGEAAGPVGAAGAELLKMFGPPGAGMAAAGAMGGGLPVDLSGVGTFKLRGHGRRINPGNVKALRRSLRRVEGFERLVTHVRKSERKLLGAISRHSGAARGGRMKGHKAGCGCVTCRRAA